MKTLPCLLGLLLAPAALLPAANSTTVAASVAAHPTVLTVGYNNNKEKLPVIKLIGTDPVVLVDGHEKRIRTHPVYTPDRTSDFGKGFVQVSEVEFNGMSLGASTAREGPAAGSTSPKVEAKFNSLFTPGAWNITETQDDMRSVQDPAFGAAHFTAKLKSKERIEGAFALVVVYPESIDSQLQLPTKYPGPNLIVKALPVLPAGEEVAIQLTDTFPRLVEPQKCFLQVFDSTGHEIRTNTVALASTYYHSMDSIMVANLKERYLKKFAGADHPLVPLVQPPPMYPDEYTKPTQPGTATLSVSSGGEVTKVEFTGIDDTRLQQSLSDAFAGWLFLPRLKSGVPIDTKVKIPLEF